ncbi:MAG: UDP-N-acetylglucosamine--N-acetylmuramyl-(pentapeptide) pyrophosphoryl-undecaprenol N-acetylglucosamine transferase [Planctomycetota bacterium]
MESPWIAFAGGGTGGHIYPALSVVEALRARVSDLRFVFFVTERKVDSRILNQADFTVVRQSLAPVSWKPWRWPMIAHKFRSARRLCGGVLRERRPAIVVGTGGLASVPALLEAAAVGIPTVVLNPDVVPGRANRRVAPRADAVFAQWSDTARHLPRNCRLVVSGCPIRPGFVSASRDAGIGRFDLDARRRTLLVTGASQGARSINEAVLACSDWLAGTSQWQVLHLTGEAEFARVRDAYTVKGVGARVVAYTEQMAEAMAAADLVLSRAGASTLAEITAVGRASILMPYPYHRDAHQLANAECLARAGAARIVADKIDAEVNGPRLQAALESLMTRDTERDAMASAARHVGRPDAAGDIADELLRIGDVARESKR